MRGVAFEEQLFLLSKQYDVGAAKSMPLKRIPGVLEGIIDPRRRRDDSEDAAIALAGTMTVGIYTGNMEYEEDASLLIINPADKSLDLTLYPRSNGPITVNATRLPEIAFPDSQPNDAAVANRNTLLMRVKAAYEEESTFQKTEIDIYSDFPPVRAFRLQMTMSDDAARQFWMKINDHLKLGLRSIGNDQFKPARGEYIVGTDDAPYITVPSGQARKLRHLKAFVEDTATQAVPGQTYTVHFDPFNPKALLTYLRVLK